MKYAVVKIGASQFKVQEGDEFEVEKLEGKQGDAISLDKVLLYVNKDRIKIGQPLVKGVKIKAKIEKQLKGKKIRVATFRAKSRYRKVKGHRKLLTKIKVEKIISS